MKRHGNLWQQVLSFVSLLRAAEKARRGKRFRPAVASFHFNLEHGLWTLHGRPTDLKPTAHSSFANPRSARSVRHSIGIGSFTTL